MVLALRKGWLQALTHLISNPLSYVGVFLINTTVVFWLFVLPVYVREGASHPYLSLVFMLALPAVFIAGLLLIPLGMYLRYRRETKRGIYPQEFKPLGWANREFRNLAIFVGGVTVVGILVGGYYSHATVKYMDSEDFCGTTCHSMLPEYTAYQESPHRNIPCVECHVGSGQRAKLEAKLNGISQMIGTLLNNHSRPIATPVHNLRPAREICESCHWPENFAGHRLHVLDKFALDEQNTWTRNVLVLKIGGSTATAGIHGFHTAPGVTIEYRADSTRQHIPWVRYTNPAGEAVEYFTEEWPALNADSFEQREMDCIDCHTRPSHRFRVPGRALDAALAAGVVDPSLPWIKKRGLEILRMEYSTTEEAVQRIPELLLEFYQTEYPELYEERRDDIDTSALGLLSVFQRNVFPDMKIGWALYPENSGHTDFTGCFRCHFGKHQSAAGLKINDRCNSCHEILAWEEPEPNVLERLGITPSSGN
jgi:nitrate/TMAO reductase-like tetraheme cytochrome c subunit